jgi:pimeloyl-ACP methyl ester carboxylesterase
MRKLLPFLLVACAHSAAPPSLSFIAGPQGKLHVDDGGAGRALPVVLVHGNSGNLTQWRAQIDHLRPTRRVVAFDLRGMGKSERPANGDYSVPAMADDVQAVADALHLKRFVLVGHSYGGAVVAQYAAKHPERVAGVIYADSAGDVKIGAAEGEKFLDSLRKDKDVVARSWFGPILEHATPATREAVFASVHDTPGEVLASALGGLLKINMHELVAAYPGPKYAIAASDIANSSSFHVQFPAVPVRFIAGTGHWLMMDKPAEFNRALDEFLAAIG